MSNSESLKGKEFIDFLLDFLTGKTHQPELKVGVRIQKHCANELKADEAKKLNGILKSAEELVFYFNAKDGFKTLVDSLYYSVAALEILSEVLPTNQKLREDFQRQHLYEGLIEFLYKRNVKLEGSILATEHIKKILTLLENASLDETVRGVLSEKSKIKELFLIVMRSIEVKENSELISTLIQFISNLCYGKGKFRKMLASEPPQEFLTMIESILALVEKPLIDQSKSDSKDWQGEGKRTLLKHAILNLIANLCVDVQLRQWIAADMGGVFSRIYSMLEIDVKQAPFDWIDSTTRELAVCINCALEATALKFLTERGIISLCEALIKKLKFKEDD